MSNSLNGPWISFAVLCEKTIEDKAGRLSLINIVDQVNVGVQSPQGVPEQMPQVAINLIAAVGFKSGVLKGANDIKLAIVRPNGEAGPSMTVSALFQGDERGTNFVTELNLNFNEEGLYWIDVFVQNQLMTRIPLRLAYQRVIFGPTS
jgi:hypothetical protein